MALALGVHVPSDTVASARPGGYPEAAGPWSLGITYLYGVCTYILIFGGPGLGQGCPFRLGFPAETYSCPRMQDETTRRQKHIADLAVRSVPQALYLFLNGPVGEAVQSPVWGSRGAGERGGRQCQARTNVPWALWSVNGIGGAYACACASRLLSSSSLARSLDSVVMARP